MKAYRLQERCERRQTAAAYKYHVGKCLDGRRKRFLSQCPCFWAHVCNILLVVASSLFQSTRPRVPCVGGRRSLVVEITVVVPAYEFLSSLPRVYASYPAPDAAVLPAPSTNRHSPPQPAQKSKHEHAASAAQRALQAASEDPLSSYTRRASVPAVSQKSPAWRVKLLPAGGGGGGGAGTGAGAGASDDPHNAAAPPAPGGATPECASKKDAIAVHHAWASTSCPANSDATAACLASSMPGRPASAAHRWE